MGQNAPYFQLRQQGVSADQARVQAARSGEELFPAGTARQTLAISARNWKTWALVVLYFTTFGGFIALTAWLPTYWREFHGASAFAAGTLTAVFSLLASVLRIVGGSFVPPAAGARSPTVSFSI